MNAKELTSLLQSRLPDVQFSLATDALETYGRDWSRFHRPNPAVVLFPARTEDVVNIVHLAIESGAVLVPSGGRTGYSAGAVACNGEWVVSMQRMRQVLNFDPNDRLAHVQAGLVTAELHTLAEQHGLFYPVDFASSGSSQIGGNIATNAGGIRVLRYGLTRAYVQGLTVVTGAGEVLQLNHGLVKNASGLDLRHLFIGSEGVLGVIVDAQMQLIAPPPAQQVALLALPELDALMPVLALCKAHVTLSSFEYFSASALRRVMQHRSLLRPFDAQHPHHVLIECDEDEDAMMRLFEAGFEAGLLSDGLVAQSLDQAKQLWQYREGISESIAHLTPYKNDISVRISRVTEFMRALDELMHAHHPDFEVVWFGHIGDGNLHLNVLKPEDMAVAAFKDACEAVNRHVYGLVEQLHGSVSAEHGVGLLKKPHLHHCRSAAEIQSMRAIKAAFDPHDVMNRGKML